MSGVALHLWIAHVPVVGSVFVLALFVAAHWRGERVLWQAGIVGAIAMALCASAAMTSGPVAQEDVRPWLDEAALEVARLHEITGQVATAALALLAVLGLQAWMVLGERGPRARWLVPALIGTSLLAVVACGWTGALGGRVRHAELREPAPATTPLPAPAPGSPIDGSALDLGGPSGAGSASAIGA